MRAELPDPKVPEPKGYLSHCVWGAEASLWLLDDTEALQLHRKRKLNLFVLTVSFFEDGGCMTDTLPKKDFPEARQP